MDQNQGRTIGLLDRAIDFFNTVPLFSDIARMIVGYSSALEIYSMILVPAISFTLIVLVLFGLKWLIYLLVHLFIMLARFTTKGSKSTGRFATFWEIFTNYTLPSRFTYHLFAFLYCYAVSFAMAAYVLNMSPIKPYTVVFTLGLAIWLRVTAAWLLRRSYDTIRKKAGLFPLGSCRGINLYVIGGVIRSLFRGKSKEKRQEHILMIGPTGSGKTSSFFMPGLLHDAFNHCSAVVVEAKDSDQEDILKTVGPVWAAQGRKIILFDPWGKEGNIHFNPLLDLKPDFEDVDTRDAIETLIDAIYRTYETERGVPSGDAAYYADQEKALLRGLIYVSLFMPAGQRNLAAIYEVVNSTLEDVRSYINSSVNATDVERRRNLEKLLMWFVDKDNGRDDIKANTLRGVAGKLMIFSDPRVKACTINNELDITILFQDPCLLCIKAPLNVVGASTMASIIIRFLTMRIPKKLSYGMGQDFKLWLYLSELPALSIPKLDQFTKTTRTSGTGIIAEIQDRADIAEAVRLKLGISSADALMGNFKTTILLPGCQPSTAKFFSDSFGDMEIKERRTIIGTSGLPDFKYQTSKVSGKLLTSDSIRYMDKDSALIIDSNVRPFFVKQRKYYKDAFFKRLIGRCKKQAWQTYRPNVGPIIYESPLIPRNSVLDVAKSKKKTADLGSIAGNFLQEHKQEMPKYDGHDRMDTSDLNKIEDIKYVKGKEEEAASNLNIAETTWDKDHDK